MSQVVFRPATKDDLETVLEISRLTYDEHLERQPEVFTPKSADNLARQMRVHFGRQAKNDSRLFVADEGGTVVGHVFLRIQPWPHGEGQEDTLALILDISFDRDHRGKGLGKRALGYVEEQLREDGTSKIGATVWRGNAASEKMFLSDGFEREMTLFGKRLASARQLPEKGTIERLLDRLNRVPGWPIWIGLALLWLAMLLTR